MATSSNKQSTVNALKGHVAELAGLALSGPLELEAAGALTAHAGGGQASALQLAASINIVTTVATAADSVKLPDAIAGSVVIVKNAAAANSMNVYPQSGEIINALAADAAYALAAAKAAVFFCGVAGTWYTVLTA